METRTPIGISEFFRITRPRHITPDQKGTSKQSTKGNQAAVICSKQDSYHMRNHQTYKTDHSGTIHGKSYHHRRKNQICSPKSVQICSQGNRYFIAQQHQIQILYCVQKSTTHTSVTGSITLTLDQLAPARLPMVHFITSVAPFLSFVM